MSLDLEIYTDAPLALTDFQTTLPDAESWKDLDGELTYQGDGWQVFVTEPEEIERDVVPDDLVAFLGRCPIAESRAYFGANRRAKPGYAFLERVVESVGTVASGVTNDFHTGTPRRFGT